jgi:hypothetical protein
LKREDLRSHFCVDFYLLRERKKKKKPLRHEPFEFELNFIFFGDPFKKKK